MITTHLMGGLGNMLFQIASIASLAKDNNTDFILSSNNISDLKHGKINDYVSNIFRNINFNDSFKYSSVYREPFFCYEKINYNDNMCIYGYFQSEKYFKHNEKLIRNLFSIDEETKKYLLEKYQKYLSGNKTTSLHVRRGDSFENLDCHPICKMKYYNEAMEIVNDTDLFLIFSDDIEWCKQKFVGDKYLIVENNKDYQDLYLMSLCNNNITANSTFSWWGAWLNNNENKKVISPKIWFGPRLSIHDTKDLIPETWRII